MSNYSVGNAGSLSCIEADKVELARPFDREQKNDFI
jgi:hypothetical protein